MRKLKNTSSTPGLRCNLEDQLHRIRKGQEARLDICGLVDRRSKTNCTQDYGQDSGENREAGSPGSELYDGNRSPVIEFARAHLFRDSLCSLCEQTVALALDIPLDSFQARTRCGADVALARQIAMYLCHTTFSLMLTEIGLHFRRDRTTVSYACALVEDKRDDLAFDVLINQLESLLVEARNAVALCSKQPRHQARRLELEYRNATPGLAGE